MSMFSGSGHCGRKGCMCSHDGGCDRGFINLEDENGKELGRVSPCRNCKPEMAEIIQTSGDFETRSQLISEYRDRSKTARLASRTAS